jgi:hypothetical protein
VDLERAAGPVPQAGRPVTDRVAVDAESPDVAREQGPAVGPPLVVAPRDRYGVVDQATGAAVRARASSWLAVLDGIRPGPMPAAAKARSAQASAEPRR